MRDRLTETCRAGLQDWRPADPAQRRLRADYLRHLDTRERPWARECTGAHLTASALVCDPPRGRVLLTLHARLGRWLQTGGHLEAGDADLPAAALRESTEESGLAGLRIDRVPLRLDRHQVPCGPVSPTDHLDVQFLVVATGDEPPVVSAESSDVAWFDVAALPDVDASVLRLVEAAADRIAGGATGSAGQRSRTGTPWSPAVPIRRG